MRTNVVQTLGLRGGARGCSPPSAMLPKRRALRPAVRQRLGARQRLLFLRHVLHGGDGLRDGVRVGRAVPGPQGLHDSDSAAARRRRRSSSAKVAGAGPVPRLVRAGRELLLDDAGARWSPAGTGTPRPIVCAGDRRRTAVACCRAGVFVALSHSPGVQGVLINCLTGRAIPPRFAVGADGVDGVPDHDPVPDAAGLRRRIRPLFEQHSPAAPLVPAVLVSLACTWICCPGQPGGRGIPRTGAAGARSGRRFRPRCSRSLISPATAARAARDGERGRRRASRPAGCAPRSTRLVNAYLLPHPLERATFHFISSTILRSARQRLFLATYGGIAVALALPNRGMVRHAPGRADR